MQDRATNFIDSNPASEPLNPSLDFIYWMQKSFASSAAMMLHYWLAYASSSLPQRQDRRLDQSTANDYVPFFFHMTQWFKASDLESKRFLKSDSFLDCFYDYIQSTVNLRSLSKPMSGPATIIDASVDEYLGAIQGSLLEMQETPHEVAWRADDVRLLHYDSSNSAKKFRTPLLMVYAPMNRYHVMDIRRERSIVQQFLLGGFDVFLLDWGRQESNKPSLAGYIGYIQSAIEQVKRKTGSQKVNVLGYSWGGVLSAIYASIWGGNIANLILQSAHIDFHKDDSILASWFRRLPVDSIVGEFQNLDCRFINLALLMRNPAVHFIDSARFAVTMNRDRNPVQMLQDSQRISAWLGDTPVMPAGLFRDFIKKLYQDNELARKKLHVSVGGAAHQVDLKNVTMPLLNVVGSSDDICPPAASLPINDMASSEDKQTMEFPCGHIELSISSAVHENLWPRVVKWLQERSL